jgi:hypothetical protein
LASATNNEVVLDAVVEPELAIATENELIIRESIMRYWKKKMHGK